MDLINRNSYLVSLLFLGTVIHIRFEAGELTVAGLGTLFPKIMFRFATCTACCGVRSQNCSRRPASGAEGPSLGLRFSAMEYPLADYHNGGL